MALELKSVSRSVQGRAHIRPTDLMLERIADGRRGVDEGLLAAFAATDPARLADALLAACERSDR